MLQQILFFLLGCLSAGLLALLVAPAVWRRSAELTRRRIEASLPMSRNEMQAVADRVRAEAAMQIRRLEVELKAARDQATEYRAQLGRQIEELTGLRAAREESSQEVPALKARIAELETALEARRQELESVTQKLADACSELERRSAEAEGLWRENEVASLDASNLQIELVSREARIDQLQNDIQQLKQERRDLEARGNELQAQGKSLKDRLQRRERKLQEMEDKLAALMEQLTSTEERLERRERELERLRGSREMTNETAADQTIERLLRERDELEARLRRAVEANRRADGGNGADADAALRQQIGELAAQFVHLTSLLEGREPGDAPGPAGIADKVRTLKQAAMASTDRQ